MNIANASQILKANDVEITLMRSCPYKGNICVTAQSNHYLVDNLLYCDTCLPITALYWTNFRPTPMYYIYTIPADIPKTGCVINVSHLKTC